MSNSNTKSVWLILEETLRELNFSAESISKIKTDLENLAKAEAVTRLLEGLTKEQRRSLKGIGTDKQEKEGEVIVQKFLSEVYNKEEFSEQLRIASRNILKDYLEYLFNNLNDEHKRQVLINFINHVRNV